MYRFMGKLVKIFFRFYFGFVFAFDKRDVQLYVYCSHNIVYIKLTDICTIVPTVVKYF